MAKGCNRLPTLSTLLTALDLDFKKKIDEIINTNGKGSSLLRLLKLVPSDKVEFPTPLLMAFMRYYSRDPIHHRYSFGIRGQRMNVTLEDVLYLTNLPIVGRAVVPNNNKDKEAFVRVFSAYEGKEKISLIQLSSLCTDVERDEDERIKAVLLMIVTCLIIPNGNGDTCNTSYVKFIENLDEVDSYAWGAAMLSYLYQGMRGYVEKGKSLDGFLWLIIGFFFHHFKGLHQIFEINLEQVTMPHTPMLLSLVKALAPIAANHHSKNDNVLDVKVTLLHEHLSTEEVLRFFSQTV